MLTIKKTTKNYDWNTTTEELLHFEDFDDMRKHFYVGYINSLKQNGCFFIDYRTGGDPRMADSWNGRVTYELV